MPRHTLNVLMQDRPGVLHRAVSLLRRRAVNIVCLSVGPSEFTGLSRMTVVIDAERSSLVTSQLNGLVEVLAVQDGDQPHASTNAQADGFHEEHVT